jgi:CRISPR-associated protein Cst2
MIKFVTFAVKMQLNVHDLNNEAVAGNVTDIRIMEFLDEDGERVEAPAVSGRMLKHWHLEGMRHLIINGSYPSVQLCAGCKVGEPIRPALLSDEKLEQIKPKDIKEEENFVKNCIICDIHGYLIAQGAKEEKEETSEEENEKKKKGKKQKGLNLRRASRAMFSWLMPVLGVDTAQKQVLHTRVSQQQEMAEGEGAAQMIFNKSYASGIYAFVSALDVDRIGLVELNLGSPNPYAVDDNNGRKDRIKVAIEAYRLMLSGQIGASLSHAIPHQNPVEILVAYSENGPLPFPVSPMYKDYIAKTIGLMPKGTSFLYWGSESPSGVSKKDTIDEIFRELLSKV